MHISGIENDILNQAKQNEIKNNNIEIFDVPGQTEKPRCQTLILALRDYCANVWNTSNWCSVRHQMLDIKFNNEWHL